MSLDNDPVEAARRREVADHQDVETMRGMALGLLDGCPAEVYQALKIWDEPTGAELHLQTVAYSDAPDMGKRLQAGLSWNHEEDCCATILFDFDGRLAHCVYDDDRLGDALTILENLSVNQIEAARELSGYLRDCLLAERDDTSWLLPDASPTLDAIKGFIDENQQGRALQHRRYERQLDDNRQITIYQHTFLGDFSDVEAVDESAQAKLPLTMELMIRIREDGGSVIREFLRVQDGRYGVATGHYPPGEKHSAVGSEDLDTPTDDGLPYDDIRVGDLDRFTDALLEAGLAGWTDDSIL